MKGGGTRPRGEKASSLGKSRKNPLTCLQERTEVLKKARRGCKEKRLINRKIIHGKKELKE